MRWQAWKRGARLALRGTGILLLILGATVLLLWLRLELNRPPKPEEILAKANGWSTRGKDTWSYVRDRLKQDGTPVLKLLADDDFRRHEAAAAMMTGTLLPVEGASLDLIIRLLPTVSVQRQRSMIRSLGMQIRGGRSRLVSLLRSPEPLPFSLRAAMTYGLRFDPRDPEAFCLLMPTALDPTVAWENRATAIDILGRNPEANAVAELEEFATHAPDVLARPLRFALSRLHNTADVERLREDLEEARAGVTSSVDYVLRSIVSFGKAARGMGPELLPLVKPNTLRSGPLAAIVLAHIGYSEAIPVLRSEGLGSDDWRLTAAAAEALGRLHAIDAEAQLRHLAATAPDSIVATIARQAAEAIQGQYSYPLLDQRQLTEVDRILNERFLEWARSLPPRPFLTTWQRFKQDSLAPFLEGVRVIAVRLTSPIVAEFELITPSGQTERQTFDRLPHHCISFAGGTLLGYYEGEWGGGVVYVPQRGPARFFSVPGVSSFIRWGNDILIAPSDHAIWGQDLLWRATTTPKGQVVVEPYKRVQFKRWSREPDGSLLFDGTKRLSLDGKLIQLVRDR
jgi:hypothetical protein